MEALLVTRIIMEELLLARIGYLVPEFLLYNNLLTPGLPVLTRYCD